MFDGPALYVTATKTSDLGFGQTTGTFWRIDTDATGGLPLIPGALIGGRLSAAPDRGKRGGRRSTTCSTRRARGSRG